MNRDMNHNSTRSRSQIHCYIRLTVLGERIVVSLIKVTVLGGRVVITLSKLTVLGEQ